MESVAGWTNVLPRCFNPILGQKQKTEEGQPAAPTLMTIPPELRIMILEELPLNDVLTCRGVCKSIHATITGTKSLRCKIFIAARTRPVGATGDQVTLATGDQVTLAPAIRRLNHIKVVKRSATWLGARTTGGYRIRVRIFRQPPRIEVHISSIPIAGPWKSHATQEAVKTIVNAGIQAQTVVCQPALPIRVIIDGEGVKDLGKDSNFGDVLGLIEEHACARTGWKCVVM